MQLPAELADIGDASAITGAPATDSRRTVPNGKPASETSSSATAARMSRARGPISDSTACCEVTSTSRASRPDGTLRRIQWKSWVAKPVPVTM